MTDILIRDVPDDVVAAIDAKAHRTGLSRTEYLRRALVREVHMETTEIGMTSLKVLTERFGDLDDPEVMGRAWS